MKIAWFKKIISPEIGADLAGYGIGDKSLEINHIKKHLLVNLKIIKTL